MGTKIAADEFDEKVLKAKNPVLVDFYASWCGPCQMMAPIIDELADELKGKVEIYKVDIEKDHELANKYGVMSIPTLFVFKDGHIAKQFNGITEKRDLGDALK